MPGLYAVLFAARRRARRAAAQAAPARGARRPPGRRHPGHRGKLRLARHGHLQGEGDGLGQAAARATAGRVFVMTGDGELQEGQNYEALLNAAQQGVTQLTVIVDHNKLQTDKPVAEISDLGDLEARVPRLRLAGLALRRPRLMGRPRARLRRAAPSRATGRRSSSPTRSRAAASRSWSTRAPWRTGTGPLPLARRRAR